jgi:transposase
MRGRRFSKDIRESVSCATKLGLDPTIIQAVTGVSKRQIQRILSEEHEDSAQGRDYGGRTRQRILKPEHLEVSQQCYNGRTFFHEEDVAFCQFLKACISRNQSIYLDELKCELGERFDVNPSLSTISRALNDMGYTRKKVW